jgi:hypothetical protein
MKHDGPVLSAAFSPDGTRVVTGSSDNTARLWDAATGAPLGAVMKHDGPVRSAAFSPDGTRVVTGSEDNTARLWDAAPAPEYGARLVEQACERLVATGIGPLPEHLRLESFRDASSATPPCERRGLLDPQYYLDLFEDMLGG